MDQYPSTDPDEEHHLPPKEEQRIPPVASFPVPGREQDRLQDEFTQAEEAHGRGVVETTSPEATHSAPAETPEYEEKPEKENLSQRSSVRTQSQAEPAVLFGESNVSHPETSIRAAPPSPAGGYAGRPPKDRTVALILEILPSFFGLLGFGWIYAGNTTIGIILLVSFIIWNVFAFALTAVTLLLFACLYIPINITIISISGIFLYNYTKQYPQLFGR
jgi:hypothetical protein